MSRLEGAVLEVNRSAVDDSLLIDSLAVKSDNLEVKVDTLVSGVPSDSISSSKESTNKMLEHVSPNCFQKMWQQFTHYPNSSVALLASIVPGGGQLYNQRYWKIPIVLSAMVGGLYAITWNQNIYKEYHTAYVDLMSDNPMGRDSWKAFVPHGANAEDYVNDANLRYRLESGSKQYKQNRDLSVVVTVALYLLAAIDAYVDAELYYFDMTPSLTIDLGSHPGASPAPQPQNITMGATVRF